LTSSKQGGEEEEEEKNLNFRLGGIFWVGETKF
jgi:hypothetical protein